jgi:hypothetical protein
MTKGQADRQFLAYTNYVTIDSQIILGEFLSEFITQYSVELKVLFNSNLKHSLKYIFGKIRWKNVGKIRKLSLPPDGESKRKCNVCNGSKINLRTECQNNLNEEREEMQKKIS